MRHTAFIYLIINLIFISFNVQAVEIGSWSNLNNYTDTGFEQSVFKSPFTNTYLYVSHQTGDTTLLTKDNRSKASQMEAYKAMYFTKFLSNVCEEGEVCPMQYFEEEYGSKDNTVLITRRGVFGSYAGQKSFFYDIIMLKGNDSLRMVITNPSLFMLKNIYDSTFMKLIEKYGYSSNSIYIENFLQVIKRG